MATPAPPKPWKAEYAKSSRSSCKTCKENIDKDKLRLGKMVVATQFDGFMPMWNHATCILKKKNQIKSVDDVEGLDSLRWDDQEKIRKYVEGESSSAAETPSASSDNCAVEVSQSARSTCKRCNQKIAKGHVRVWAKPEGQKVKAAAWHHASCFLEVYPSTDFKKLSGWDTLPADEKENVLAILSDKGTSDDKQASKSLKRKNGGSDARPSKAPKFEAKKTGNSSDNSSSAELQTKLKEQSEALWKIKDELKNHVSTSELKEFLNVNEQDPSGSEHSLRDRCADGMLFGALGPCPVCSGSLHYSGGQYRCSGFASEWGKCSYATTQPVRIKTKWKIPEGTKNDYLLKWFKSQKAKKPVRVLPPMSPEKTANHQKQGSQSSEEGLGNLRVSIIAESTKTIDEWKEKLSQAGATFHDKVKKDTSCLVLCGDLRVENPEVKKARRMKIPVLREDYLHECMRKNRVISFDLYKVESALESKSGIVTVKVKGRSAVHEASGMQDTGHILEDGKSVYNTTLNLSDLSTGVNSYYILQIIQEDKGSECYVFRKWGRVGNEKIGGSKLEAMPKHNAIDEFERLFLEKTGNAWEDWERKTFQKQPGKFFPLDIDYGVKQAIENKNIMNVKSSLPPQLQELIKMLFNVETYRAAMMEFEINMSEMPLGKLSKENIQRGFEALSEIENLLSGENSARDPAIRESLIVGASNRFFTLIPSLHPHVIRDEDDFKAKVKMLEALQDIEIASRLVGFDTQNDDTLDDKYKKLCCDITPLPHDSKDYELIKHYLLNTHAPTHRDWSLELEEVFAVDRHGEFDKYASYRNKLQNKMLLWHGSRLTNFVGILSQGLRIAPKEAPSTGYMFGKGIYFADLVSKSAQYCFVDRDDPVGLMLLSEVALGDMYELTKSQYMDKPPKGKHSTKGLGKNVPLASEFQNWKDDVVVPCGKPVPSDVRASELMYNEYIVYNTSQVKLQFLLKVRFHHKR